MKHFNPPGGLGSFCERGEILYRHSAFDLAVFLSVQTVVTAQQVNAVDKTLKNSSTKTSYKCVEWIDLPG